MAWVQRPAPESAAQRVVGLLRAALASGDLRIGDRLPSERELSGRFGVSRATVREALAGLEVLGLVQGHKGQGTFVTGRLAEGLEASPVALMEARLALEPYESALAALRATPAEVDELDAILARSEASADGFEDHDGLFHLTVARASHNDVLTRVSEDLRVAREERVWGDLKSRILRKPGVLETYREQHRAIFQAIAQRNGAAASEATRLHLETVSQHFLTANTSLATTILGANPQER